MDFQAIVERVKAIETPGFKEVSEATVIEKPEDPALLKKWKMPKDARTGEDYIVVEAEHIEDFSREIRDDVELRFELLVDVTGVDADAEAEDLWVVYHYLSLTYHHRLMVKCHIPKENAEIPTLSHVFPAANWHEREASEMYGINFLDHPDPRNMLLPDDWVGYPLRKDYEFPEEYNGISCV